MSMKAHKPGVITQNKDLYAEHVNPQIRTKSSSTWCLCACDGGICLKLSKLSVCLVIIVHFCMKEHFSIKKC